MSHIILVFLSFLQSVMGFTLLSSSVMHFREPIKKRVMIGLAVMLCGIILLSSILFIFGSDSLDRFAIFVILIIQIPWFLICSEDRFFVSLFNFLTFVNIYVFISYTSDTLVMNLDGNIFIGVRIIVRMLIYAIILPLLFKFVRPRFRRIVDSLDKEWRAAIWVPLLLLLTQSMIIYYPEPYWYWTINTWSRVIILMVYLLSLAVYYLFYIQASAIVEKYALEKRQLLVSQQEKLWESELTRQKATTALASQQRHDMHHHNAVIMGLLQNGDIINLESYMISCDKALEKHHQNLFCLNPIANSILNFYAERAREKNIETEFKVSLPEQIGIDNIDLTCVLGNALENAIEGCLRLPKDEKKEIIVTIKYFDHRLRIKVENTCALDILFKDELPITHKMVGGTGTKSILYTAESYDGTAGFSVVGSTFIAQIVLNSH